MNDYRFNEYPSQRMYAPPTIVRIGGKVLYRGTDAPKWLKNQKDRNIKACAKLCYN